ncbi:MAG: HIT family protein [Candidatus Paceibacterota bacterium]|jgi:histidine triad (HIT) family protein
MDNCIFCKIVTGEIPSNKVYEDDHVLAFLDIRPVNPGHTLVIPKDHFENIYTLPDETFARMSLAVKKVSVAIKQAVDADGINLGMNNEEAAGQVIFHAHIHIMPRVEGDGLQLWPQKDYKDGEAASIADRIKKEL